MKFMLKWQVPQQNWLGVLKQFLSDPPEERKNWGEGVKYIGRWHDASSRSGVGILESDNLVAVQRFVGRWNAHLDVEITPVLDDEEVASLAKQILADNGQA